MCRQQFSFLLRKMDIQFVSTSCDMTSQVDNQNCTEHICTFQSMSFSRKKLACDVWTLNGDLESMCHHVQQAKYTLPVVQETPRIQKEKHHNDNTSSFYQSVLLTKFLNNWEKNRCEIEWDINRVLWQKIPYIFFCEMIIIFLVIVQCVGRKKKCSAIFYHFWCISPNAWKSQKIGTLL